MCFFQVSVIYNHLQDLLRGSVDPGFHRVPAEPPGAHVRPPLLTRLHPHLPRTPVRSTANGEIGCVTTLAVKARKNVFQYPHFWGSKKSAFNFNLIPNEQETNVKFNSI